MRRGAVGTTRSLAEQSSASEDISKAAGELHRMIASTAKAISDQAASMNQITAATDGMSAQAEQVLRGAADQARAMRAMTNEAQNTAKQIKSISKANTEHSAAAAALLVSVGEIRQITDRNAAGVKQTRGGTDDLRRRAQALVALVDQPSPARKPNGRPTRSGR
jgi:methyl-accepting chemotaxis protein